MKKGIAIVLLLCLLLSVFSFASAATVKLAIKGGRICLRTGAGTSYSVICHLKDGQKITVLSQGNSWSKVKTTDGKEGYIKNLYIAGIGKYYADGTTYYTAKGTAYVDAEGGKANLRAGASSSTGLLTTLTNGTKVTILGENGSWKLITTSGGTQGFISNKNLSETKSSSSSDKKETAKVNATGLYMRTGPNMSYEIITCLKNGTTVNVISKSAGKWWLVSYGSLTGYMFSGYLVQ